MLRFLILFLAVSLSAWGKDVVLFDPQTGHRAQNYDELVRKISKGDTLVFSDGFSGKVEKLLGQGATTKVFQVEYEGKKAALRIPPSTGNLRTMPMSYFEFINETLEGYPALEKEHIPIPTMLRAKKSEYVLMEKVNFDFSLGDFLRAPSRINDIERDQATKALLRFAQKAAKLDSIGDFHVEQLVYSPDKHEWVLLDWAKGTRSHEPKLLGSSTHIFSIEKHDSHFRYGAKGYRTPTAWEISIFKRLDETVKEVRGPEGIRATCASFFGLLPKKAE